MAGRIFYGWGTYIIFLQLYGLQEEWTVGRLRGTEPLGQLDIELMGEEMMLDRYT